MDFFTNITMIILLSVNVHYFFKIFERLDFIDKKMQEIKDLILIFVKPDDTAY